MSRKALVFLGKWLRRLADRIDDDNAPHYVGWSFTFEQGRGLVFREGHRRGCPLAYLSERDYERAHTEAESAQRAI